MYLACIDELAILQQVFHEKIDFFKRLCEDYERFENEDNAVLPHNADGEKPAERIQAVIAELEESLTRAGELVADLRDAMNTVSFAISLELRSHHS